MAQLPTLCMVNYEQEEPPGFRYRFPGVSAGSPRGGPVTSPRHAYSLPNSPRYQTGPGTLQHGSNTTGFPAPKQTFMTSKDDTYATHNQNSSTLSAVRERLKSRSHEALPLLHTANFNSGPTPMNTAEPRSRALDSRDTMVPPTHYYLPPLKTMGETSLTANAELLDEPEWNECLQAWVSGSQGTAFAYISFAGGFSLQDRGIFDCRPDFEDAPVRPCPRFYAHMHHTEPPKTIVKEVKKRVTKKPEFWTWKGRTAVSIPKPKPKRKVTVSIPCVSPVPETPVPKSPTPIPSPTPSPTPTPPPPKEQTPTLPPQTASPILWETFSSRSSLSAPSSLSSSVSERTPPPVTPEPPPPPKASPPKVLEPPEVSSDNESQSPVKTPVELQRLSSPPHTVTPVTFEEVESLDGRDDDGQFEEDEDGNVVPRDEVTGSSLVRLHFAVDYYEVLEPEVYGEALEIDASEMSNVGVISGLELIVDPPLKVELPWRPDVLDTDRVDLHSPPPPPIPAPKVPTPPPPREPTPPPPPSPTPPPPKSPTPPPKSPTPPPPPTPKAKRKPIVKKTKPPPPPPALSPKCPTPKPPTPKPPTPKIPTPKPPTPIPTPPKEPTPPPPPPKVLLAPPPLPPVIYRDPTPPPPIPTPTPVPPTPKLPTPQPTPEPTPVIPTPTPPTPTPPPQTPTPEPEEERRPLPPAQKDSDFLAERERERLAEQRRARALEAFESLKQKKFVRKDKPIPDELVVKEYGWLAQFCILKEEKVRMYQMAFDTVDEDEDGFLSPFETLLALKGITGSNKLTEKEEAYILRVLDLADYNLAHGTDFRLFSMMAALYQKIASIDKFVRNVIEKMDLETLDWKMFRAKELFAWCLDDETRRLKMDNLLIELRAGGVSLEHQQECEEILGPKGPLDLLDFLTYLPLFVLMHDSVVGNPLDMTMDK